MSSSARPEHEEGDGLDPAGVMRAVYIGRWFRGEDDSGLRALAEMVDLTVYGHRARLPGQIGEPPPAPSDYRARVLHPIALTRRGPSLWLYRGLARALDQDRPDVIHVVAEPWQIVPVQTARWATRNPSVALVVHGAERNWWAVPIATRLGRGLLARRTLSRADGFLSESTAGLDEARQFGIASQTVLAVVNTNPRDPATFHPPNDDSEQRIARECLGLAPTGIGIGFLGRLSEEKGPLLFVDAITHVMRSHGPQAWAATAGSGPQEAEVRRRGAEVKLTHLGELRYPEEVATFLRGIDILVVPSVRLGRWEEQGPRAVIEAMLSGCVVVGTPVGGIPEMLNGAGIVVGDAGAPSLAAGIAEAISIARHSDLRSDARTRAIELYSGEGVANAMLCVWKEALSHRRANSSQTGSSCPV